MLRTIEHTSLWGTCPKKYLLLGRRVSIEVDHIQIDTRAWIISNTVIPMSQYLFLLFSLTITTTPLVSSISRPTSAASTIPTATTTPSITSPLPLPIVTFHINTTSSSSPFQHPWQFSVGSGHAKLALRSDWRTGLNLTAFELGIKSVRFHGSFDDDMGPVVTSNETDETYNFTTIGKVFDAVLAANMTPYVELSFMPTTLASGKRTYLQYSANVTPPKNVTKWSNFIKSFGQYLISKYGEKEISKWYFECWNEPDLKLIGPIKSFWTGTMHDYYNLYIATSNALKSVSNTFRIGGPATSNTSGYLKEFVNQVKNVSVIDFLSSHAYPNDKDRDAFSNRIFEATSIASELKLPYVLSEFNDGLTHFCCHDTEYAAIFMLREAAAIQSGGCTLSSALCDSSTKNMQSATKFAPLGMSFWTFSDVFEEVTAVSKNKAKPPFHNAFGMMTMQGIKKPIWRAMQLLHDMNISFTMDHITSTTTTTATASSISSTASSISSTNIAEMYASKPTKNNLNKTFMDIIVINFTPAPSRDAVAQNSTIHILTNCSTLQPSVISVTSQRIDAKHSNSFRTWKNQWKSQKVMNQTEVDKLNEDTKIQKVPLPVNQVSVDASNTISIQGIVTLPISAVVLHVEWSC